MEPQTTPTSHATPPGGTPNTERTGTNVTSSIPGTYNARDLGGIPLDGGGTVRSGVLLRSDALAATTEAGLEALRAQHIGTIIDFRTETERTQAPNRLPQDVELTTVTLPLLEGAMTGGGAITKDASPETLKAMIERLPALAELYLNMLEHSAETFATVARHVAHPLHPERPAVLIHCTAGKDRTGVATALLLSAIGAERAAIIEDYTASEHNLAGPWAEQMRQRITQMGVPLLPQIDELVTATPRAAIEGALNWVEARGGAAAYLTDGGLTQNELTALTERLAAR